MGFEISTELARNRVQCQEHSFNESRDRQKTYLIRCGFLEKVFNQITQPAQKFRVTEHSFTEFKILIEKINIANC